MPPASTTPKSFLIDSLPLFLDKLADALRGNGDEAEAARKVASEHAEQRVALTDFNLGNVLTEYKILRQTLFDQLEGPTPVSPKQRDALLNFIHNATAEVITRFGALQAERIAESGERERKAKDEFVATLSHDLKTPLQSARLAVEVLLQDLRTQDKVNLAKTAMHNLDRIDKMIENLLDASAVHAGQELNLKIESCNLRTIVEEAVQSVSTIYGPRFSIVWENEELNGFWSPAHLTRCMENLLTNAVKYGADGEPITITVSANPRTAKVAVHNNGEPIPQEQLHTLFNPYQRHVTSSKPACKGWGLGLALCKGVVSAHGGKISAESDAKNGTRFIFEIPRDCRERSARQVNVRK